MTGAIVEKFSKKRGRKPNPIGHVIDGLYQDEGTRSRNNKAWMARALNAIGYRRDFDTLTGIYSGAYSWLVETTPQGKYKRSALVCEVGRLDNAELIQSVAAHICQQKPKVKDGIVMVRGYRQALTGKQPAAPDPLKLANEIIHTINSYMQRYPETTDEQIIAAIRTAAAQIGGNHE